MNDSRRVEAMDSIDFKSPRFCFRAQLHSHVANVDGRALGTDFPIGESYPDDETVTALWEIRF